MRIDLLLLPQKDYFTCIGVRIHFKFAAFKRDNCQFFPCLLVYVKLVVKEASVALYFAVRDVINVFNRKNSLSAAFAVDQSDHIDRKAGRIRWFLDLECSDDFFLRFLFLWPLFDLLR